MRNNVIAMPIEERRRRHAENEANRRAKMSPEEKIQVKVDNHTWRRMIRETKIGCNRNMKCSNPLVGNTRYCFEHWLDRAYVAKTKRYIVTIEELVELWNKQNGKCVISKCILVPGKNVSLDHIIPPNKNGTKTIENLRFINYNINLLKHEMLDVEIKSVLNEIGPALLDWARGE